ncbi:MAG: hypothetical protein IID45_03235 [Planctomycetes bacterium]|nr:hypothetical protein [Planctomycetota bacterium]
MVGRMEDPSREAPPASLSDVEGYPLLVKLGLPVVENGKQILRSSELPKWLTHWDQTDTPVILPREPIVDAVSAWLFLQVKLFELHEIQEANTFRLEKATEIGTARVQNAYRLISVFENMACAVCRKNRTVSSQRTQH